MIKMAKIFFVMVVFGMGGVGSGWGMTEEEEKDFTALVTCLEATFGLAPNVIPIEKDVERYSRVVDNKITENNKSLKQYTGLTLLQVAVIKKEPAAILFLLYLQADPSKNIEMTDQLSKDTEKIYTDILNTENVTKRNKLIENLSFCQKYQGFNALHLAAYLGHEHIFKRLLSNEKITSNDPFLENYFIKKRDPSFLGTVGEKLTGAFKAATGTGGQAPKTVDILSGISGKNTIFAAGYNALHLALSQGNFKIVTMAYDVLKKETNRKESFLTALTNNIDVKTSLFYGCNALSMVTLFDGDICQNDDFLKILGSLADDTEACSWIRDKSIRYKLIDGTYAGFYPLQLAALNQKSKYVEKLLTFFKHGEYYTLKHVCTSFVEIKSKEYKKYNGFNIFHLAAYNGDYESFNTIIKKLLEIKALKEVKQEKDPTKKVVGAEEFKKNKPKEVWGVALIPVGCEEEPTTKNYTSQDNFKDAKYVGFNIFHLATYNGKIPFLIKTLSIKTLKHEAFKKTVLEDNKKFSGYSVLHLAARKNYLKTTKWLVENGANVMVVDKAGKTAFDVAKEARKDAVSKYLEEAMRLPRALILFKSKLLKLTLSLQP